MSGLPDSLYDDYFGGISLMSLQPAGVLKPFIRNYTICRHRGPHLRGDIDLTPLPTGYVELYFHLRGTQVRITSSSASGVYSDVLVGSRDLDAPLTVRPFPSAEQEGIIIAFTYPGVLRLLGMYPRDIRNAMVTPQELWGWEGILLKERLDEAAGYRCRTDILNDFFLRRLSTRQPPADSRYIRIINFLSGHEGRISLDDITRNLDLSYLSVYRMFDRYMGISPKQHLKILRFHCACRILADNPGRPWSEVILACGYYDQAHFIHEFTSLMKTSPQRFLDSSGAKFMITQAFRILKNNDPSSLVYISKNPV